MINMLTNINMQYNRLFYFDFGYRVVINDSYHNLSAMHIGGSILSMPEPTYHAKDKVLTLMENDQRNISTISGAFRYLNEDLLKLERAVIAAKYFKAFSRQYVLDHFNITTREYYNALKIAEEKLIELWRLDCYGDKDELGIPLSKNIVDKRRTDRTGIEGGYFARHPEWQMQFYKLN
jgi:hypothetical protein